MIQLEKCSIGVKTIITHSLFSFHFRPPRLMVMLVDDWWLCWWTIDGYVGGRLMVVLVDD
jgi:hypothetical protein